MLERVVRSWPAALALSLTAVLASACREPSGATRTSPALRVADAGAGDAAAPLQGCAAAERLVPPTTTARSVVAARGSTALHADTSQSRLTGCRDVTSGPEAWYALELAGFAEAVELHAVVDASFDAVLELRRGPCGDTVSLDCDRARGIASTGSSIAARLEPGAYWLLVDGADATSQGEFQLQVELDPAPDRCTGAVPDATCAGSLRLEPLARQTLLLDEACAPRREDGDAILWYELDLEGEPNDVLVHAAAWTLSEAAIQRLGLYAAPAGGSCESELASSVFSRGLGRTNAELTALVPPGRYQLELALAREPQRRAALELGIDRDACRGGPVANRCEDAIPIDASVPRQVLAGNTACNTSQLTSRCAETDAPDQFYRLDVRSAPGPVRARVQTLVDGLGFPPHLALLTADAAGNCADVVYCDERIDSFEGPPRLDVTLEPNLYYVVVDGADQSSRGAYRLLIELEPAEPSPCVDTVIDQCVSANGQADCCLEWSATCSATVALCGLARATQECLCATAPSCCTPERDESECRAARAACNYLCPEFAASEDACLAPL